LYPVLTSENFGIKNVGSNYGAVMVGFMLSALLFPILLSDQRLKSLVPSIPESIDAEMLRSLLQPLRFSILGVLAIIGAVLVIILRLINIKQAKKTA